VAHLTHNQSLLGNFLQLETICVTTLLCDKNVRLHRNDDQNDLIFINQWFLSQLFGDLNKFNASKKWQVLLFERAGLYDRSSQATCPAMTF
jgi:hypothetical protein